MSDTFPPIGTAPSATTTMLNRAPNFSRSRRRAATIVQIERNLRNQDHVRAAGDARVQRNPAGIPPHHLDHHDAVVRLGRGVQPIDGVGCEVHRGVEPEAADSADDVVVDGFRHADDRNALLRQLVRDGQRAVAADDDERVEAELVKVLGDALRVVNLSVAGRHGIREGIAAIGRAENRAAQPQNAGDVFRA